MIFFDDESDIIAKDPAAEREVAARIQRKADRKEEKKRLKEEQKAEEARLEAERIAALPPPPVLPRRWDFRFKDPKANKGIELAKKGTQIVVNQAEPACIVAIEQTKNEPYVGSDFPIYATDCPGTWEPWPEEPAPVDPEEEALAAAVVADEELQQEEEGAAAVVVPVDGEEEQNPEESPEEEQQPAEDEQPPEEGAVVAGDVEEKPDEEEKPEEEEQDKQPDADETVAASKVNEGGSEAEE